MLDCRNKINKILATIISGIYELKYQVKIAVNTMHIFAIASFLEHSHTDCIFISLDLYGSNKTTQIEFIVNEIIPI
jgi:hypothetical protein